LADAEPKQDGSQVSGHLREAFQHIDKAIRCYLHFLVGKAEGFGLTVARYLCLGAALAAFGVIGVILAAVGLGKWLETNFHMTEGAGLLCVGIGIVCATLGGFLLIRGRRGE